jgi:hypothetical protein
LAGGLDCWPNTGEAHWSRPLNMFSRQITITSATEKGINNLEKRLAHLPRPAQIAVNLTVKKVYGTHLQ